MSGIGDDKSVHYRNAMFYIQHQTIERKNEDRANMLDGCERKRRLDARNALECRCERAFALLKGGSVFRDRTFLVVPIGNEKPGNFRAEYAGPDGRRRVISDERGSRRPRTLAARRARCEFSERTTIFP